MSGDNEVRMAVEVLGWKQEEQKQGELLQLRE